jgi:hypothetical protein
MTTEMSWRGGRVGNDAAGLAQLLTLLDEAGDTIGDPTSPAGLRQPEGEQGTASGHEDPPISLSPMKSRTVSATRPGNSKATPW